MLISPSSTDVPVRNYAFNSRSCTSYSSTGYFTMCERDLRFKTPPAIWEWRTSCPISHPYVLNNGKSCCQTNMEELKTGRGEECDGSAIDRESTCCKGELIKCPTIFTDQQCSNNPSALHKNQKIACYQKYTIGERISEIHMVRFTDLHPKCIWKQISI